MHNPAKNIRFGIALKLGLLLAAFGIVASGFTGYYTYHTTRDILVNEATQDLLQSTQVLGRRFSIMADGVADDARFLAQTRLAHQVTGNDPAATTARQTLADQFSSLLAVHPEYFQIRLISARQNGIEVVRVDRDVNGIEVIHGADLQEKHHYPYVYETLKLTAGQVYFSRIFINRETGAHAGLKQPTLQVATPVATSDGTIQSVIVINVDLDRMFSMLKTDLAGDYRLYLANQRGDYLIHPDSSKTFGFDYGRRFLMQEAFKPVSAIVEGRATTATVRTVSAERHNDVIGGFASIPFGQRPEHHFVIIGLTVPLNTVLAEISTLARNSTGIVISFSLLAIALSALLALIFVRPLRRLVTAVQRFSETRELTPVPVHSHDELGMLSHCISRMQEQILAHLNDLRLSKEDMEHRARHDTLTGAPNREMLLDLMQFSIIAAHRNRQQLAVLFIDLDRFKAINDRYGHAAGDAVLVATAQRLKATVRESDTVARLSGDEFVVMIQPVDDPQQVAVIAQKLIDALLRPIEHEGQSLHISASIGISIYPIDGKNTEELLHNADAAMYNSKRNGRNTFRFYS